MSAGGQRSDPHGTIEHHPEASPSSGLADPGAAATGFALLAVALWGDSFEALIIASFVLSIGLAPVFALSAELIIRKAPEEKSGPAAAIAETNSELGGALGIAVLGCLVSAFYQVRLTQKTSNNVEPELAAQLEEGFGSALVAIDNMAPVVDHDLSQMVLDAFTSAFASIALINFVLSLLAAMVARYLFALEREGGPRA